MRFAYLNGRPVVRVSIAVPGVPAIMRDAMLDTGADLTVFPDTWAARLGIDLTTIKPAPPLTAANGTSFICYPAPVSLQLLTVFNGMRASFEWRAIVGFSSSRTRSGLLGRAGCLEFFDTCFLGADQEVTLTPNRNFPGKWVYRKSP